MSHEATFSLFAARCDGCGTDQGPFMKLSMGKDFFGRAYDRLSPSLDQSPKWYCERCSLYKNLQRDCRDIRAELDKAMGGQPSELNRVDDVQRARLRLQEIATILSSQRAPSSLIDPQEVNTLIQTFQSHPLSTSVTA